MALTHVTATRSSLADVVGDQLDSGFIVLYLSDVTTEVATIPLGAAAFPASVDGSTTWANSPASDTDATGNASAVANFTLETSGSAEVLRGAVGTSGSDLNLSSLTIANGDTVTITSFVYNASA